VQVGKHRWQKVISSLKGFVTPRSTKLNQLIVELREQLDSLKSELSQLQSQHGELETGQVGHDRQLEGLQAADEVHRSRAQSLLDGTKSLEQRCGGIEAESGTIRDKLKVLENSLAKTATRQDVFDKQIRGIEAESGTIRDKLKVLENSLAKTASWQDDADQQIRGIEGGLEDERKQYQVSWTRFDERLAQVQNEQQSILEAQLEMVDSMRKSRRLAPVTAAVALLVGVLAGAAIFRVAQKEVPEPVAVISEPVQVIEPQTIRQDKPVAEEGDSLLEGSVDSAALETEPVPADRVELAAPEESVSMAADQDMVEPQVSEAVIGEQAQEVGAPSDLPAEDEPVAIPAPLPLTSSQAVAAGQTFDADAFFRENASREGVVSLPSGLQYKILKAGRGISPGSRDMVILHYRGRLPDGRVFDDSYAEGAPAAYRVDQVIPGWREALQRMQEGAKWELYIPPKLAHSGGIQGAAGYLPRIYQIELISVSPAGISYTP